MRRLLSSKWLLWSGTALLLAATPAVSHASCNHATPRIAPSEAGNIAPRVRFVSNDEAPAKPATPTPANPSQLPCLHCGASLPSLPPVTAPEFGGSDALCHASAPSDDSPNLEDRSAATPIYAFAPLDAIEHPPRFV